MRHVVNWRQSGVPDTDDSRGLDTDLDLVVEQGIRVILTPKMAWLANHSFLLVLETL